jgi:hypothetical protein
MDETIEVVVIDLAACWECPSCHIWLPHTSDACPFAELHTAGE